MVAQKNTLDTLRIPATSTIYKQLEADDINEQKKYII